MWLLLLLSHLTSVCRDVRAYFTSEVMVCRGETTSVPSPSVRCVVRQRCVCSAGLFVFVCFPPDESLFGCVTHAVVTRDPCVQSFVVAPAMLCPTTGRFAPNSGTIL